MCNLYSGSCMHINKRITNGILNVIGSGIQNTFRFINFQLILEFSLRNNCQKVCVIDFLLGLESTIIYIATHTTNRTATSDISFCINAMLSLRATGSSQTLGHQAPESIHTVRLFLPRARVPQHCACTHSPSLFSFFSFSRRPKSAGFRRGEAFLLDFFTNLCS
jgi:hypothetical protein